MSFKETKALRRWQLFVDCLIFISVAAICELVVGGLGDCAMAPTLIS